MNLFEKVKKKTDPCWKGYKQLGMKDKDGKSVPNCVQESINDDDTYIVNTKTKKVVHHLGNLRTTFGSNLKDHPAVKQKLDSLDSDHTVVKGMKAKSLIEASAYDRINKDFKKLSGKSLEDASKKYDDIQKKLADQRAKYIAQGTLKESNDLDFKEGDTVWAKHPIQRHKVLTGTVTKIGRTLTTLKHKDGTTMTYPHSDVSNSFEKLNPNPYRKTESIEQIDELSTMTLRNYRKEVDNTPNERPLFKRVKSALGYSRATQKIKNNSIRASAKNESEQLEESETIKLKIDNILKEKFPKLEQNDRNALRNGLKDHITKHGYDVEEVSNKANKILSNRSRKAGNYSNYDKNDFKQSFLRHIKENNKYLYEISQSTKDSYIEKAKDQVKEAEPYTKGKSDVSSFAKRLIDRRKKGLKLATEALSVTPEDQKDPATYVKKKGVSPDGEHSGRKVRKGIAGKLVFDKKDE